MTHTQKLLAHRTSLLVRPCTALLAALSSDVAHRLSNLRIGLLSNLVQSGLLQIRTARVAERRLKADQMCSHERVTSLRSLGTYCDGSTV